MRVTSLVCALLNILLLAGCSAVPSHEARSQLAESLAAKSGWQPSLIATGQFQLLSYHPAQLQTETLSIYIEGDGLAWISRSKPSRDPTPTNPIALKLALAEASPNSAYLARPCQFVRDNHCKQTDWTSARFSEAVVSATNKAVSHLKRLSGASQIRLIGYSGGGAVAALVAARRDDVSGLITVAGNLDHRAWTQLHRISPLSGSLNPADFWQQLAGIPQLHFVGGEDQVIPLEVAKSYQQKFPQAKQPRLEVVAKANHRCCWVANWPQLISEASQP